MRSRHPLLGLLLGLASFAWTITVLPPPADAQSPKRGGTLRVSYGNEIAHLDFYTAPGYELNWVAMNIGCGLLGITPDGKFVPDAAESWHSTRRPWGPCGACCSRTPCSRTGKCSDQRSTGT